MKKVLSVILVFAMVISCVAMMQINSFAASTETILDVNFENSSAKGYNPDGVFNNTSKVTYTHENGALKFDNSTAKAWETPLWNLTADLKAFAAKNPSSTITVSVSLKMKSDTANATAQLIFRNGSNTATTLVSKKAVGTSWTSFSGSYSTDSATVATAGDNDFRLLWDNTAVGVYYVDDLKVTFTATGEAVGMQFEVTKTFEEQKSDGEMAVVIANTSFNQDLTSLLSKKDADGNITVSFKVFNDNDYDIKVSPGIQVAWTWLTLDEEVQRETYTVKAKSYKVVSFTFDVDADGKALDEKGNKVALNKATYRIDIFNVDESGLGTNKAWGLPKGAKLTIAPATNADMALLKQLKIHTGVATAVDTLPTYPESVETPAGGEGEGTGTEGGEEAATPTTTPTPTPTPKVPTGIKLEYTEDFTGLNYIISAKGVFTDADVKDGELTKTYKVTNNGEDTLKLKLRFQLTHTKADGGKTWAGPTDGTFVEIEPGETAELTYTAEVEDGKVTVDDTEYPVSELFVRLEIGADGNVEVLKGTSFTVYCGQTVAEALTKGSKGMKNVTVELVYDKVNNSVGTGDVLPVAFIALVAVATVALVVVSKKKREEF